MAKKEKPDQDLKKAEAREDQIRARLAKSGGMASPIMKLIANFFGEYHQHGCPSELEIVLKNIEAHELLALSEYRYGIAGGISGVFSNLSEEEQEALKKNHRLLESVLRLQPPPADEAITQPGQVEYLWMQWIVLRQGEILTRVFRLAHRLDQVGEMALGLLAAHASLPEVKGLLGRIAQQRQPRPMPIPADVPVADVRALKELLLSHLPNRETVTFVAWLPGEKGGFLVVMAGDAKPLGCPATWRQRPVMVRKATAEEMVAYRALKDAADEP